MTDILARLAQALASRYRIVRELGEGGMATVFLAEDLKHNRQVALKVLKPELAAAVGAERFLREVEITSRLQHPHILTLLDSGQADGLPFYVMPYVEGESLEARIQARGALPVPTAVTFAKEIADALAYAHARGVVHRDIKPGNVLLSNEHAVVADFGIASALGEATDERLTRTGVALGSPMYASPEQALEGDADHRADLYALGCVLHEMLTGVRPFDGSGQALLSRKLLGEPVSLRERRPDVPTAVAETVNRAMTVDRAARFQTADELRSALESCLAKPATAPRHWVVPAAVVVLGIVVGTILSERGAGRALALERQYAELERLANAGELVPALTVAREIELMAPGDSMVGRVLPEISFEVSFDTEPSGARVFLQYMDEGEASWSEIGTTPVAGLRVAGLTVAPGNSSPVYTPARPIRLAFELDGHARREVLLQTALGGLGTPPMDPIPLEPDRPETSGMIPIPGFTQGGVEYGQFYMDRYEVTNAEFSRFVEAGGYESPEFWREPFFDGASELAFEDAVARFEDETGQPGPSIWQFGTYPDGTADHPVGGVSWFEAAAYAVWAGKQLPTTAHWNRGRFLLNATSDIVFSRSNLGASGARPVGENAAMTALGVYDLIGNVREWCYNETDSGERATRGGAWPDAPFHVGWIIPKSAWDRDPTHGFRLVRIGDHEALDRLQEPVSRTVARDYWTESPVSDAEFEIYRRLFDYAPVPLEPRLEDVDTTARWVRQHVSFNAPYGGRAGAILYMPLARRGASVRDGTMESVLYWGGSPIIGTESIDDIFTAGFDFLVRSGRTVVVPQFAGAFGRPDPRPPETRGRSAPVGSSDTSYRDIAIRWVTDVRTTIDYLLTRPEFDPGGIGYFGFSFGGTRAPTVLAVEPRIAAAVLNVGGLSAYRPLPEVDALNFLPRVRTPLRMVNGEFDVVFPLQSSQLPFFEYLGTDAEHKDHSVTPGSHMVPRNFLIRETLDWFDRYLGEGAAG